MLTLSRDRVTGNTDDEINEWIRLRTENEVARCAAQGPEAIERRLGELDAEWDIERMIETMAPTITLSGLILSLTRGRKWLLLPIVVNTFLLQHAIQGWCPPLPVLRALGYRTTEEIDRERYALKAMRGDFKDVDVATAQQNGPARQALAAVNR